MQLNTSTTTFHSETHQYFNSDGKELSGITSMLHRTLFQDKYSGVAPEILAAAAQYGTAVHEDIQAWERDNASPIFTPEGEAYKKIRPDGYQFIAEEYLVSNETTHASKVDLVFTNTRNEVILADIKCNANLDEEYLSWQLSTYAYLFELQNPQLKVKELVGIWLPRRDKYADKSPEIVRIKRIEADKVRELLEQDANGTFLPKEQKLPQPIVDALQGVNDLLQAKAKIEAQEKAIKENLLALCEEYDIKKWDNDHFSLTYVAPTTSERVDAKALKEQYPEVAKAVTKTSNVKSSIRLKLK